MIGGAVAITQVGNYISIKDINIAILLAHHHIIITNYTQHRSGSLSSL